VDGFRRCRRRFRRLLAGLRAAGCDPSDGFAWDARRSPYPGLNPFAAEDAAVFFGRERETARLVELLQPTLQHGASRFVAIVGPSGSGKSSLLRAGLLPRLARSPERWVLLPPLVPGDTPTRSLAISLSRAFADHDEQRSVDAVAATLKTSSGGLRRLATDLTRFSRSGVGQAGVLVVIDQAEELITRAGAAEQRAFLGLLAEAMGEDSPVWVVATVRSEYLSAAPDRAGLADTVDDPLILEPLSRSRLAEVIARPAQRAGLELVPGLVERMVDDTAGGDALPLLAYTLQELCRRAGPDGQIDLAAYDATGGVARPARFEFRGQDDPQRTARKALDTSTRSPAPGLLRSRHGATVAAFAPQTTPRRRRWDPVAKEIPGWSGGRGSV
jgi:energy-coupling factor transporter ATP-binding protein EcfA2